MADDASQVDFPHPDEITDNLTEWKNEPSVRELKQDYTDAKSDHDIATGKINTYLDNLNVTGSAKIANKKGRSSVQPKLIRKQAEWRYSSLSEPFLSTPDIFNVYPVTEEDKQAAIQNQLVLNNQVNTKMDKVAFIDEFVRAVVDEGTAFIRVGWEFEEEEREVEVPVFEYTPSVDPAVIKQHQKLYELMQRDPEAYESQVPPEWQDAHSLTIENQTPYSVQQVGTEIEVQTVTVKNHPTWEIVEQRNLIIDPSCKGKLHKAKFVIYSFETSLAELKADGRYQNLDKIQENQGNILAEPDHHTPDDVSFNFSDKPRKRIVVHEYWGEWDIDGSGLTKPILAAWAGNVKIRMEENPYPDKCHPFVDTAYLPVRKEVRGEPDGVLLDDNQKIIGAVSRGMIDILGRSANGQTGTRKDALDITNKRKFERGDDYEFNSQVDPRQAFYMHTFPEIPQSAQFMLGLQTNEADNITGVKAFGPTNVEGLGDTATAARGAMDAASKRELGILRRLAEAIKKVGRKIIAMNAEFLSEEEIVRITNDEFVAVRRDDLAGEFDLRLAISTAEEDNAKAQELAFMMQTLGPSEEPKMRYMLMADIARLRKMPEVAAKLEAYEPQPTPYQQQMMQLELQIKQAELAKIISETRENDANAMLDQAKAGTEQAKAANLGSDTDLKNLDFIEQESGVKQARELEKQGEQARANAELKLMDAALDKNNPTVGPYIPTPTSSSADNPTVSNGLDQV